MKAILLRTQETPSKFGGVFYYAFFKGDDGRSYRSCLSPKMRNFNRWSKFIGKEGVELDGLVLNDGMIDADSKPVAITTKENV